MVDRYFTIETTYKDPANPSSQPVGYTFSFDRLNTKSIREYSEGELPYHEQTSLTNRVYSKMITQNLLNDPDIDIQAISPNITTAQINPDVTARGNNPYCPPGYRFPNFKEWVLMSLYLSEDYLRKDKNGNSYSPGNIMPSRTYYDKGYYGSLKSDTEPWSTESGKVGWNYSDKMHCVPASQKPTRSRCVKDEEMTGHINGDISLDSGYIYPDDNTPITLTLSSTASTLTAASLKLCYNAHNGNYREIDIPVKSPKGIEYRETQTVSIPSLAELGLTQEDIDAVGGHPMTLRATAINAWGNVFEVEPLELRMVNPIGGGIIGEPTSTVYPADNGSVTFNFVSNARTANLLGATMSVRFTKPGDSEITEVSIPVTTSPEGKYYYGEQSLPIPALSGLGLTAENFSSVSDMEIYVKVEMEDHVYRDFHFPVTLVSHLFPSTVAFPTEFTAGEGMPIVADIKSINNNATITSASLWWKLSGGSYTEVPLTITAGTESEHAESFSLEDLIGAAEFAAMPVSPNRDYHYKVSAVCSDGTSYTSPEYSMYILHFGKNWNPGPWSSSNTVSQISNKWTAQTISSLDFEDGDFVDAHIDVTNCVYFRKDGTSDNDIGMDNLISLGDHSSTLEWKAGNIIFYYPAHNPSEVVTPPDQDKLQIGILHYGYSTIARVRPYTLDGGVLTVRLEKDLLLVNGAEPDWSLDYTQADGKPAAQVAGTNTVPRTRATVSHITSDDTIKIGSIEGKHRSRATYNYVRVVRKL